MSPENERSLESGIVTDLTGKMTYGSYLALDQLLTAQHPVSDPEHHDEMLFIIQHQTTELWLKQLLHELSSARQLLASDDLREALKRVARVKKIQDVMTQQWGILATLTPTEYAQFRGSLGNSSGFQSVQYRAVEFALGNKNEKMLQVFRDHPANLALLTAEWEKPTLYDEFLRYASRRGLPVPASILERDVRQPYRETPELVPAIREIYQNHQENWDLYEACEDLVDLEDNFQFWRFRHLKTVARTIGMKVGTGGSSGVGFLQRALDLTFFPELYTVRTEIGG
ncbi:tryptophan 2,3-dioxygenase family protein [Microbacterium sp. K24]|jgi:tryptophan 2,3-dioxygenase|uniref:tryptophan 2,3-dioxygenase n=1 Tax=Microbacterium sp. K24 TaxID=2305446 RepID=UPI00109C98C0|nr:tryptophan 2,3-dioxygenase family protein [Microbacterium sp. K24]